MTTILCILFWIITPLIVLLTVLTYLTETQPERIRRLKREGKSQQAIATALGISRYRVRQALA